MESGDTSDELHNRLLGSGGFHEEARNDVEGGRGYKVAKTDLFDMTMSGRGSFAESTVNVPGCRDSSSSIFSDKTLNHEGIYDRLTTKFREEDNRGCLERFRDKIYGHWNSLRTPNKEEGLDFDTSENRLYQQRLEDLQLPDARNLEVIRWMLAVIIAIIVSCIAIAVDVSVTGLTDWKFDKVREKLKHETVGSAFLFFMGWNGVFVGIATLLVAFLDVKAKGSGVPEIKSYLNGRKIHRVISIRTLLSKIIGVIFSVSGSLVLGKEGPMMHAGAVVGAIVSQGQDEISAIGIKLFGLRSDKEKRSFVSIGCACGVAAAFSAPLGGVLFVIEEAASFWSVKLTWRTFFATMVCAAFVDVVISGVNDNSEWGVMSQSSVISFGSFEGASRDLCYPVQPKYRFLQVPIFICMGALGGLVGAGFNKFNLYISHLRVKYVSHPTARMSEALFVSLLTSILLFGAPYCFPCRSMKDVKYAVWEDDDPAISGPNQNCSNLEPFGDFCPSSHEMNDLETLLLSSLDMSVKKLFHSELIFSYHALAIYCLTVMFLACVTYGTSIPSGLFVPAITIGAAAGRLIGQFIFEVDNGHIMTNVFGTIDPGTYALIGSAAMLGGITRMTISIVVILMETTNNSTYAVPIMLTIMSAKVVGDVFTEGLYDMHIRLQGIKFLHDEPEETQHKTQVREVMIRKPIVFNLFERVSDIIDTLQHCTHNGFPVVSNLAVPSDYRHSYPGTHAPKFRKLASHRSLDGFEQLDTHYQKLVNEQQKLTSKARRRYIKDKGNKVKEHDIEGVGVFEGTILRSQLLILLYEKVFVDDNLSFEEKMKGNNANIHWREFYKHYPRSPSIKDVCGRLTAAEFDKILDLRPYLDSSALTIHYSVYMSRVHQLFRHLGLRHLTVVNTGNQVVGIVTRAQIAHHDEEHSEEPNTTATINPRVAAMSSEGFDSLNNENSNLDDLDESLMEEDEEDIEAYPSDTEIEAINSIHAELSSAKPKPRGDVAPLRVINSWKALQTKLSFGSKSVDESFSDRT
mmetsp:Transcript_30079/g.47825  ORF Transcript_30079/g.47825 Transcript_30079/m.47825 type:complete len:1026 (-) Transcript_30079:3751-6828(-)